MKLNKLFPVLLIVILTVSLASCKKNRFCHCISESYNTIASNGDTNLVADTVVVNVDRGMKCENIYEMGVEVPHEGIPQIQTRKFDCKELDIDKDSVVIHIPTEHPTDD